MPLSILKLDGVVKNKKNPFKQNQTLERRCCGRFSCVVWRKTYSCCGRSTSYTETSCCLCCARCVCVAACWPCSYSCKGSKSRWTGPVAFSHRSSDSWTGCASSVTTWAGKLFYKTNRCDLWTQPSCLSGLVTCLGSLLRSHLKQNKSADVVNVRTRQFISYIDV